MVDSEPDVFVGGGTGRPTESGRLLCEVRSVVCRRSVSKESVFRVVRGGVRISRVPECLDRPTSVVSGVPSLRVGSTTPGLSQRS